jgi:hypothetical protein
MPNNNPLEKAVNLGQLQMAYEAGALLPVDISTLTPASTFPKNAVIGINGVLYRATAATQNLPCTMTVQDGQFVVNIANGKTVFTVTNPAPNEGWEIFTDASVEYWINQLNALIAQKATVGDVMQATVNYGQTQFTVQQLLQEMAKLMSRTVVINA